MADFESKNPIHYVNLYLFFSLSFTLILLDHIWFLVMGYEPVGVLLVAMGVMAVLAILCISKWWQVANANPENVSHSFGQIIIQFILIAAFAYIIWVEFVFHFDLLDPGLGLLMVLFIWFTLLPVALIAFFVTTFFYRPFRLNKSL